MNQRTSIFCNADEATAAGIAEAKSTLASIAQPIYVMEAAPGPSIETAYAIGWNSIVFSLENAKRLRIAFADKKAA